MEKYNFIIIGIDTLRADHLSCYGYVRKTSPNIDKIAEESIVFKWAFANGIPTHPAWTTILTGVHPLGHGIVTHMGSAQLSEDIPMVQEVLRKEGYVTGAVDNMFLKYGDFYKWFTRGFHIYSHPGGIPAPEAGLKVQADDVTEYSIKVLKELLDRRKPFFMFIHYWDPHSPYRPPKPYNKVFWQKEPPEDEKLLDYAISQYDGEIQYVDDKIGELIDFLREKDLLESTVLFITSDHGENLQEHGDYMGHKGLYDNVTRVPLIMRLPSGEKGVREDLVQHVDIAYTIYELAGVKPPIKIDGKSLVDACDEERPVVLLENTQQKAIGLRTRDWKLIVYLEKTPDEIPKDYIQLFNLKKDPGERTNLAYHEVEKTKELKEKLDNISKALLRGEKNPLLEQAPTMRKIKFYSQAKSLIELYGLIIRQEEEEKRVK